MNGAEVPYWRSTISVELVDFVNPHVEQFSYFILDTVTSYKNLT